MSKTKKAKRQVASDGGWLRRASALKRQDGQQLGSARRRAGDPPRALRGCPAGRARKAFYILPATMRAAKALFPKGSRKRLRAVADLSDHHTDLSGTIRCCAIIVRDIEKHAGDKKPFWLWLTRYALRDVILAAGYNPDRLKKIIDEC